jgi:hypothetical protein
MPFSVEDILGEFADTALLWRRQGSSYDAPELVLYARYQRQLAYMKWYRKAYPEKYKVWAKKADRNFRASLKADPVRKRAYDDKRNARARLRRAKRREAMQSRLSCSTKGITPDIVRAIRSEYDKLALVGQKPALKQLGQKYGITYSATYSIVKRINWKHVV